jgi:hypothetical protein
MDEPLRWVLIGLVSVFVLAGSVLAVLERIPGLRPARQNDGSVSPSRAIATVELAGGILILIGAVWLRQWLGLPSGVGVGLVGVSEFVSAPAVRQRLRLTGMALLVGSVVLARYHV